MSDDAGLTPGGGARFAPIAILTDFGTADWYVAEMKGVLLARAPGAPLVDLTHEVGPGDVAQGALLLARAHGTFPAGTVFLAVVDPGVGTSRKPIAVRAEGRWFVGPDNGLLECALDAAGAEARTIDDRMLLARASATFHGRDVFAPVAARLAAGGVYAWQRVGAPLDAPVRLAPALAGGVARAHASAIAATAAGARLATRVVHVDRFGNVILGLHAEELTAWLAGASPDRLVITAHGPRATTIRGLVDTYGHAPTDGRSFALFGSSGLLEIAMSGENAARALGLALGDAVELTVEQGS